MEQLYEKIGRVAITDATVLLVGESGNLGQMGYCHHLPVLAQLPHELAHRFSHGAAHTRIYLVKNECLRLSELACGDGNGQGNAG